MPTTVLFLCTGNSVRSQMAEAFLRHYGGDRYDVHSAGLEPKGINPYTIQVMDEVAIDIRAQTSDSVRKYLGIRHFNYAVTVCANAETKCPHALWSRGIKLHWPFDDPAEVEGTEEEKLAKFREVRDLIATRIRAWVAETETV